MDHTTKSIASCESWTIEDCLAAVQRDGHTVRYLTPEQRTDAICIAAVTESGATVCYLTPEQRTSEICLAAVRSNRHAVRALDPEQLTTEVCLAAVQHDGNVVYHLSYAAPHRVTPDVCLAAVNQSGRAVRFLTREQQTSAVCLTAQRKMWAQNWRVTCFMPKDVSKCTKWTPELHAHHPTRTRQQVEIVVALLTLPLEIVAAVAHRIAVGVFEHFAHDFDQ